MLTCAGIVVDLIGGDSYLGLSLSLDDSQLFLWAVGVGKTPWARLRLELNTTHHTSSLSNSGYVTFWKETSSHLSMWYSRLEDAWTTISSNQTEGIFWCVSKVTLIERWLTSVYHLYANCVRNSQDNVNCCEYIQSDLHNYTNKTFQFQTSSGVKFVLVKYLLKLLVFKRYLGSTWLPHTWAVVWGLFIS